MLQQRKLMFLFIFVVMMFMMITVNAEESPQVVKSATVAMAELRSLMNEADKISFDHGKVVEKVKKAKEDLEFARMRSSEDEVRHLEGIYQLQLFYLAKDDFLHSKVVLAAISCYVKNLSSFPAEFKFNEWAIAANKESERIKQNIAKYDPVAAGGEAKKAPQ